MRGDLGVDLVRAGVGVRVRARAGVRVRVRARVRVRVRARARVVRVGRAQRPTVCRLILPPGPQSPSSELASKCLSVTLG